MKHLVKVLVAVLIGSATALALAAMGSSSAQAQTVRTYGGSPLDEVINAAANFERNDCGLSRERLSAMMLPMTFTETGAPSTAAPGPMTLSRWDTQAALYAFGNSSTAYQKAFWHPGVGVWQFDSAGYWPLTAATAIDSRTSAAQAAQVMSSRYCQSKATTVGDKMRYAWAPWYYCAAAGDNPCIVRFRELFDGTNLVNVRRDDTVSRHGGVVHRRCRIGGIGDVDCAYVQPTKAEGYAAWANVAFGPTPVTSPFYVFEANGREYRYWMRDDSGYGVTIAASKPVTADARTSLTWSVIDTGGATLCDLVTGKGDCAVLIGTLDNVNSKPGGVQVRGWTIDQGTADPTNVRITVDGVKVYEGSADVPRPDVGAAYPAFGPNHGFDQFVATAAGRRQVCVVGVDVHVPITADLSLGCRTVDVLSGSPFGKIEAITTAPGKTTVAGWALDPDGTGAIPVHVYIDGVGRANVRADLPNTAVATQYPAYGANHGFSVDFTNLAPGNRSVCVFAIESFGVGSNTLLECRVVNVPGGSPFGAFVSASRVPGELIVRGWSIDPDTTAPIPVHIYVDGIGRANITANGPRPDVAAIYPAYGPDHGFSHTVTGLLGGPRVVCVFGIESAGAGSNVLLGCTTVTLTGGSPIGNIEGVVPVDGGGGVTVVGWTLDPDTTAPIDVHVYLGSAGVSRIANLDRPDVAIGQPPYGPKHGFSVTVAGPPGTHQLCVYAINVGVGGTVSLGCRTVVL